MGLSAKSETNFYEAEASLRGHMKVCFKIFGRSFHRHCSATTFQSRCSGCRGGYRPALFLLVTVLAKAFFTLVGGHLVAFSFLSAWHIGKY